VSRSIVPPDAACDRSARRAAERREEGSRKQIVPKVADNPLIAHDSLQEMEGNGSNFLPFLSSKSHPGHARDAFWKLRGAKGCERDLPAGRSFGRPGQAVDQPGRYIHPLPLPARGIAEYCHNLLKTLDSEKEMKGNEKDFALFHGRFTHPNRVRARS